MALLSLTKSFGLENMFYMVQVGEEDKDWWQVRLVSNHFTVVATAGYERALECLYNIVLRYKTATRLRHVLNNMSYPVSKRDSEQYRIDYAQSIEYADDVEKTIKKAMDFLNNKHNHKKLNKAFKPINKKPLVDDNKGRSLKLNKRPMTSPRKRLSLKTTIH